MKVENKLLSQDEIYKILINALFEKFPIPPADWCRSKLDEEIRKATRGEYEPNAFVRQQDALETSLFYLVDYALRMPERINLTESNNRVKQMCEELAIEIKKITLEPELVVEKHGKLKSWLCAILSVQTCLIYCEGTDRHNAEQDEIKRLNRINQAKSKSLPVKRKTKTDGSPIWRNPFFKKLLTQQIKTYPISQVCFNFPTFNNLYDGTTTRRTERSVTETL